MEFPEGQHKWLRKKRAAANCNADSVAFVNGKNEFVELSVSESETYSSLTKASLVFQDFSLSLQGKISSSKLISILKILEVTC